VVATPGSADWKEFLEMIDAGINITNNNCCVVLVAGRIKNGSPKVTTFLKSIDLSIEGR